MRNPSETHEEMADLKLAGNNPDTATAQVSALLAIAAAIDKLADAINDRQ